MRRVIGLGSALTALVLLSANAALACHVSGRVLCPGGDPLAGVRIDIVRTHGSPYSESVTTDADGEFALALPAVYAPYTATVAVGENQQWVTPTDGVRSFSITPCHTSVVLDDFVILDPSCAAPQATQSETWGLLKSAYR